MANMASVSYRIEGPRETLEKINDAILKAMPQKEHWDEWEACINLGFTEGELDGKRLGGEISEEPSLGESTLEFYAEERWGLQDFNELLEKKFPEIKVYWIVEESGCEVYATNDKEGKYFPERYWVDTAVNDQYQSEYFKTEEGMFKWLSELLKQPISSYKDLEAWNEQHEELTDDDMNFISIHQFDVCD